MPTTVARGTSPRPLNHGTVNAYGNQGCRCGECVEAWRVYQRDFKRASRVPYATRVAIALSILNHRPPTEETCQLAIRALRGYDVVAEAGR
jgi:hypothetical protein